MPDTSITRAHDLATYLNENSLFEEQVNHLDILDALASLGFELTDDSEAHSTSAYYSAVEADLKERDRPKRRSVNGRPRRRVRNRIGRVSKR